MEVAYHVITQTKPLKIFSLYGLIIILLRPVHNTTQNNALHCIAFASTLVEMQYDARIDSGPILALPCVAFLRLVVKKSSIFLVINLCVSRINAMQGLASLCEPAFTLETTAKVSYTV